MFFKLQKPDLHTAGQVLDGIVLFLGRIVKKVKKKLYFKTFFNYLCLITIDNKEEK